MFCMFFFVVFMLLCVNPCFLYVSICFSCVFLRFSYVFLYVSDVFLCFFYVFLFFLCFFMIFAMFFCFFNVVRMFFYVFLFCFYVVSMLFPDARSTSAIEATVNDAHFVCFLCFRSIQKDSPVYMQKDRSFCSAQCRRLFI